MDEDDREVWAETGDDDPVASLLEERTDASIGVLRRAVQSPAKVATRRALRTAVRNIIAERLVTQTDLAAALKCSRKTVYRMLSTDWHVPARKRKRSERF
jgi:hypothetical protein